MADCGTNPILIESLLGWHLSKLASGSRLAAPVLIGGHVRCRSLSRLAPLAVIPSGRWPLAPLVAPASGKRALIPGVGFI